MISRRMNFILNILLFILVIYVGINYINEVHRTYELTEEIKMENLLAGNGKEYEANVDREELALKLWEEEIQRKRSYIDKCMDLIEQKQDGLQEILKIGQEKVDECFKNRNGLLSEYTDCLPKLSDEENIFRMYRLVNKIKNFVLFIGYARSGHSIVAALLDAHPHVIVSHELTVVHRWVTSQKGTNQFNKYDMFNEILSHDRSGVTHKDGWRNPNLTKKYYTLDVPGLYQGQYKDYIQVIGDKRGGITTQMDQGIDNSKRFFTLMERFQDFVGCPLKIFHIVRNPYDNIATEYLYSISKQARKEAVTQNRTFETNQQALMKHARSHLTDVKKLQRHIEYFGKRLITLHNEDLISNPKLFMKRMCNHIEIYCNDYYLEKTSDKVFSSVTKSRHSVVWKQDVKNVVDTAIKTYPFLNRYSFEN